MQVNTRVQYPYSDEYTYRTRLVRMNLEKEMQNDLSTGMGFLIKEPQALKKSLKSPDSIYSERFMKTLQDDNAFADKYSCECKTWQGINKKGLICPFCHTEVKFIGDNFEIFGWIKLKEPYKIIHPNLFKIIQSYFGNDNLQAIIEPDIELNTNGTKMTSWEKKAFKKKMANKKKFTKHSNSDKTYAAIGMMQFREQFDEILEYFHKKNGTKKIEQYEDIVANRENIFTGAIPVFSTGMRPFKVENGVFTFEGTNAIFNIMAKLAGKVNQDELAMYNIFKYRSTLLWDLQDRFNALYEEIEKTLAQKKGNIRLLIGGKCSFTNRSIIVPDLSLRIDEIKLSYHALVELLQQTIVNILKHTYNCTYSKAYSLWYKAQLFPNDMVRQIIQNLIDYTGGIKMLVNRNPSIQYGSILCMRCIGINDTFTMSMPLQVNMTALYYGDIVDVLL